MAYQSVARFANGVEIEWNAFKIYYCHINKTLEFYNDFYGTT